MFLSVSIHSTAELGWFIKSMDCYGSAITVVRFEHSLKIGWFFQARFKAWMHGGSASRCVCIIYCTWIKSHYPSCLIRSIMYSQKSTRGHKIPEPYTTWGWVQSYFWKNWSCYFKYGLRPLLIVYVCLDTTLIIGTVCIYSILSDWADFIYYCKCLHMLLTAVISRI